MKTVPEVWSTKDDKGQGCVVMFPQGTGFPKIDWENKTIAYPPLYKIEPLVSWKNVAGDTCYGSAILKAACIEG